MSWVIPWRTPYAPGPSGDRRDACALALISLEPDADIPTLSSAAAFVAWAEDGAPKPTREEIEAADVVISMLERGYVSPFVVAAPELAPIEDLVPDLAPLWRNALDGLR